ncbi:septation protein SepH [Cellulosimicrobium marinum]|uniref:septation protein SepH n=1 Tax=Cellulosimicrobium marinum TaxID=1638992 RepID=UPI001E5ED352|nr:septation protein SepH [Cellulosimicrobium marinum]MCB7138136.1 DUF3071 domain-containing protein [Cellulosimicrobium marinum]
MDELELVRLHEDGEHLVLGRADGDRFVLPITEALRAAVRRDRPHLEHLRAEGERNLTPREIQARLRAGDDVEDVADAAGMAVEHVRRFAGPVVAEQEFVVERVRGSRQGHDDDAPTIAELAEQRFAARDVDPGSVTWSAARDAGSPWVVTASFEIASGPRTARWSYDPSSRALLALDDEARWLSQPEGEPDRSPGAQAVFDVDASPRRGPDTTRTDGTDDLLDDLGRRRGVRARSEPSGADATQEPFEGFGPRTLLDGPGSDPVPPPPPSTGATVVRLPSVRHPDAEDRARPPGAPEPDEPRDAGDATRDERHDAPHDTTRGANDGSGGGADRSSPRPGPRDARKGRNRSRAKVPSWDEIVFGARPEH